jgi:hypothetical protein
LEVFDATSKAVIGAAIDVHRELGPGLLEAIYEECLAYELHLRGHHVERQRCFSITYKGSYLKLSGFDVGLLINFNVPVLKSGVRRLARIRPQKTFPSSNLPIFPESS